MRRAVDVCCALPLIACAPHVRTGASEEGQLLPLECDFDGVFADVVVDYDPTAWGGQWPTNEQFTDPDAALGPPDYTGGASGEGAVSLGRGGVLTVGFSRCVLTGSGDDRPDLSVYEVGPNVEEFEVSIRPTLEDLPLVPSASLDDDGFIFIGVASGRTPDLDIDAVLEDAADIEFDQVRLRDDPHQGLHNVETPGADIDALELRTALSTR